jgi:hypothetical protein
VIASSSRSVMAVHSGDLFGDGTKNIYASTCSPPPSDLIARSTSSSARKFFSVSHPPAIFQVIRRLDPLDQLLDSSVVTARGSGRCRCFSTSSRRPTHIYSGGVTPCPIRMKKESPSTRYGRIHACLHVLRKPISPREQTGHPCGHQFVKK